MRRQLDPAGSGPPGPGRKGALYPESSGSQSEGFKQGKHMPRIAFFSSPAAVWTVEWKGKNGHTVGCDRAPDSRPLPHAGVCPRAAVQAPIQSNNRLLEPLSSVLRITKCF